MQNPFFKPLVRERRGASYAIVFGVWFLVAVYAVLHDQYVVRIAPEHFTVYHAPIWGLESPSSIAAAWAFKASLVPGVLLGFAALVVARHGARPQISIRRILLGTIIVIAASEVAALSTGAWVHATETGIYPDFVYPDFSKPMLVTQTIQLTCYLASGLFSALWLGLMWRWRRVQGAWA